MSKSILDALKTRARLAELNEFAVFSECGSLSIGELDRNSDSLAVELQRNGIGTGSRLILVSRPGPVQISSLVAAWKVGALVAPLDRSVARMDFRRILADFKPALCLFEMTLAGTSDLRTLATEGGHRIVEIGEEHMAGDAPSGLPSDGKPEQPAVCIFTSGSTGKPKGVLLSHANLVVGAQNVIEAHALGPRDRVLCILPLSHLNGLVTTFVSPLLSGGSVVFMQQTFSPKGALALVDRYSCTWISAVPTHYALMVSPVVGEQHWSLKSLRFCRSASAPLSGAVLRDFEAHYGVPLVETMGTTETSGQIFSNPMPPLLRKVKSVGRPIGFEVRLVGESGDTCRDNESGEIQVKGRGVMIGYLDDESETRKAFDGAWFKTGDLAIRDSDGYYFIKGRKKDIAVFCGLNISLSALEEAIRERRLVTDIACVREEHRIFGEVIALYAIPRGEEGDLDRLARALYECIAQAVPSINALSEIRFVSEFPRSGAEKVLKYRFPQVSPLHTSKPWL
jgi:long-chain acyl-CoA synthetase